MGILDSLASDVWEEVTDDQRQSIVHELAGHLGPAWHFQGVEVHAQGAQIRRVAMWECAGARFALIPSAEVTLGYDRTHPRVMNDDEIRAWGHTILFEDLGTYVEDDDSESEEIIALMREHSIPSLAEYLNDCTSPLRLVTIGAVLMETRASNITVHPWPERKGVYHVTPMSHRMVREQLAGSEFRLPTSDEWEYACSGGARTLFRWGDTCPLDRCPSGSASPDEAYGPHIGPNVFGLHIAQDPYHWEMCAEPGIMRGGDGGSAICGGAGFFLGWLPLASAYVELEENEDTPIFGVHIRRVRPLA